MYGGGEAVIVERHRRLGWKGFYSNIMFGDFVEACYPFIVPGMSAAYCRPVRVAVQFSCVVAGAILGMSWGVDLTRFIVLSSSDNSSFFCESVSSSSSSSNSSFMSVTLLSGNGWVHEAVLGGPIRSSAYFPLPFSLIVSLFSDSIAAVCRLAAAAAVAFFGPFITAFILLRSHITEI
jgi:hypothetical protein